MIFDYIGITQCLECLENVADMRPILMKGFMTDDDSGDICGWNRKEDEQPFKAQTVPGNAWKAHYHLHSGAF